MQVLMELTGDEIRQELNYPLICETKEEVGTLHKDADYTNSALTARSRRKSPR